MSCFIFDESSIRQTRSSNAHRCLTAFVSVYSSMMWGDVGIRWCGLCSGCDVEVLEYSMREIPRAQVTHFRVA